MSTAISADGNYALHTAQAVSATSRPTPLLTAAFRLTSLHFNTRQGLIPHFRGGVRLQKRKLRALPRSVGKIVTLLNPSGGLSGLSRLSGKDVQHAWKNANLGFGFHTSRGGTIIFEGDWRWIVRTADACACVLSMRRIRQLSDP